ncbi:transporter substrate-binding domain-containing protein [Salinisphaera sp. SPP-AMP-43]|uniref:transporter substrate-binding domain-containing protein n=1 Tax=Salinisphaera sp. SPP-AMP-43 TaxID=3121288 RepID=UPI003C6E7CB4
MGHRDVAAGARISRFMLVLLLCLLGAPAFAQQPAPAASALPDDEVGTTLRVGTKTAPPFVVRDTQGRLSGLSIALWQRVADQLGLKSNYVQRDLPGLFAGLENGDLDVAVAALTVTEPREARIDFTFPFYTTGLAIAVPADGNGGAWRTVSRVFSWPFLTALAALAGVLLLVGVAVWAFERHRNPEEFGGGVLNGLGSGFWWAAVTMTTVGYGDKSPRTLGGRLIGLVWMFAAIIVISSFTAAIATSLTVDKLSSGIQNVNDLAHARVTTVAGSAAAVSLADRGITFNRRASLETALTNLAEGRVDAVVYDAPLLKYRIRRDYASRLSVLDHTFERQDYAFALPQGSHLREPVNRAILAIIDDRQWSRLVARYIGSP